MKIVVRYTLLLLSTIALTAAMTTVAFATANPTTGTGTAGPVTVTPAGNFVGTADSVTLSGLSTVTCTNSDMGGTIQEDGTSQLESLSFSGCTAGFINCTVVVDAATLGAGASAALRIKRTRTPGEFPGSTVGTRTKTPTTPKATTFLGTPGIYWRGVPTFSVTVDVTCFGVGGVFNADATAGGDVADSTGGQASLTAAGVVLTSGGGSGTWTATYALTSPASVTVV